MMSLPSFSPEEKQYIAKVMSAGKYDILWYELSCLVPCTVILVLGMINGSYTAIAAGLIVYLLFQARNLHYQSQRLPVLQSIFSKLAKEDEESPTESP